MSQVIFIFLLTVRKVTFLWWKIHVLQVIILLLDLIIIIFLIKNPARTTSEEPDKVDKLSLVNYDGSLILASLAHVY